MTGRGSSMGIGMKNNMTEALMQCELASWIIKTSVGNRVGKLAT